MNQETKKARSALGLVRGPDPGGGSPDLAQGTGAPGADPGDGRPQEAGGVQEARDGNAPALVTEADDLEAGPEIGRKMSQAGGDPKRLQRATAQPDGHAVVVGDEGKVGLSADPLKGKTQSLSPREDTKRKRRRTRTEKGSASVAVTEITVATIERNNTPTARRRRAKTKIGRGSQTESKAMSSL